MDQLVEPRSFRPLARLENSALSYVVNDHLGTPKEVLSSEGAPLVVGPRHMGVAADTPAGDSEGRLLDRGGE